MRPSTGYLALNPVGVYEYSAAAQKHGMVNKFEEDLLNSHLWLAFGLAFGLHL